MMYFFLGICFIPAMLHLFPANARGGGIRERGPFRERLQRRYRSLRELTTDNGPDSAPRVIRTMPPPRAPRRRRAVWRPDEEAIITHLRARTYHRPEGGETLECSICREPINEGESMAELDCPCQFSYHFRCMRTWIMENNSCPTCRQQALNIPHF